MAGFVKLDAGMLNSTVWFDLDQRNVFLTALLMAEPREFREPRPQLDLETGEETGWMIPPGWYGVSAAAAIGIVAASRISEERAMSALAKMGQPEKGSRSHAFEGRRLVRVEGGFVVLNYMRYREHDYTAAERAARYRARKAAIAKKPPARRVKSAPQPVPVRIGLKADDALYNLELMRQDAARKK